jgi:hypothetical protein
MKWLFGIGIVALSFFVSLSIMNYFSPLCPSGQALSLKGPFQKFAAGYAYVIAAPSLNSLSDNLSDPTRSSITMCEDSRLLGPAHSVHVDIDAKGRGRFSHWNGSGFVFSATDNSDPNTNGRSYWAVLPP